MIKNNKRKGENITLKSLENTLRRFPEVQPPETLKSKLFETIPRGPKVKPGTQIKLRYRFWNYGVPTVAAALILAFMFMVNCALTISDTSFTPSEDTSLYFAEPVLRILYDQNDTSSAAGFVW